MEASIYLKQNDAPPIPITTRIEWFPDGKIKPLIYWTPDNSCYEVKHVYESTLLAFLKEGGVGIRFKINAVMKDAPDHSAYIIHETYLYFADSRFCEKGFIDDRYGHPNKEYISVMLDIFPNGTYELVYFKVGDNRYAVERTLDVEPRGSFLAGGIGIWHKVDARLVNNNNDDDPNPNESVCCQAALFWELNKWFIVKAA